MMVSWRHSTGIQTAQNTSMAVGALHRNTDLAARIDHPCKPSNMGTIQRYLLRANRSDCEGLVFVSNDHTRSALNFVTKPEDSSKDRPPSNASNHCVYGIAGLREEKGVWASLMP